MEPAFVISFLAYIVCNLCLVYLLDGHVITSVAAPVLIDVEDGTGLGHFSQMVVAAERLLLFEVTSAWEKGLTTLMAASYVYNLAYPCKYGCVLQALMLVLVELNLLCFYS